MSVATVNTGVVNFSTVDFTTIKPVTRFVEERFKLAEKTKKELKAKTPEFGYNGFGAFIFYRTYSRSIVDYSIEETVQCDGGKQFTQVTPVTRSLLQAKLWLEYIQAHSNTDASYTIQEEIVGQESWADCVIRVIEGVFSIRKNWYIKNHIAWSDKKMQSYARDMAISLFDMWWMPPGRGLWAMGTEFVYDRGASALQNCGYIAISDNLGKDFSWLADMLMLGVGVGYNPVRNDLLKLIAPVKDAVFVVEDSREGWCALIEATLDAYTQGTPLPLPDYSKVRGPGKPIRGFGGLSSGPEPLDQLYKSIIKFCDWYIKGVNADGQTYDSVMLKSDIANTIGCMVVSGNVRRSAELACTPISDPVFMDLKNYDKYPYREAHGWMSNNSVILESPEDFGRLGEVAARVSRNGEPGYLNLRNFPHGRIGKFDDIPKYSLRPDKATGVNPCGEQPLQSGETCNIAETCPTRCPTTEDWYKACEYAAFYTSTVSLLLTHRPETNAVIVRNRRIGVGIIDVTGWKKTHGTSHITQYMRKGYDIIRTVNKQLADEAGVVQSIRVTTIKPGGSVPKLAGRTPGIGYPTFKHTLRRVRVAQNSPIFQILVDANIPHEPDVYSANTEVFEWPILQGPAKCGLEASVWEQAMNVVLLQREWSDNSVSNTLYFRPKWYTVSKIRGEVSEVTLPDGRVVNLNTTGPDGIDLGDFRVITKKELGSTVVHIQQFDPRHEEDELEAVLSAIAPLTKSVSLLPHSPVGAYAQMPEEGITEAEYEQRLAAIKPIDWSKLSGSDGFDERYCTGDKCELPVGI